MEGTKLQKVEIDTVFFDEAFDRDVISTTYIRSPQIWTGTQVKLFGSTKKILMRKWKLGSLRRKIGRRDNA